MIIIYENVPCPILLKEEPDTFLIIFKYEQKWIFRCSLGHGKIIKDQYGKCYLFNGKPHREYGPAVEYCDGTKRWYIEGKQYSEKEYKNKKKEIYARNNFNGRNTRFW